MARTQPNARIENVVAVCDFAMQAAPRTISTMPNMRNQIQDFLISSIPAANWLEIVVIVLSPFDLASVSFQCTKASGAFFGTDSGVPDFGSALNFPKTDGFSRKCNSRAFTRF